MNASQIELKLVLDHAGIGSVRLGTFSERFNVQKRIYLIQLLGYDMGYRFSWYLRGPYCRQLTEAAFTLRDELGAGDQEFAEYTLSEAGAHQIKRAEQLWDVPSNARVGIDQWLELLASIHYLKHIAYWPKGSSKTFEAVFQKLIESKPQFSAVKSDAEQAWQRLEQFGLVEQAKLG